MKATTTLGNLIEQVEIMSKGNFDESVPLSDLAFENLSSMWVSGVQVEILPAAQRLFAQKLKVPVAYLEKCPSGLQADNLNFWLEKESQQREEFFLRFNGHKQIRAAFSSRYTVLNNQEVLAKILTLGFKPEQTTNYLLNENLMVAKFPDPQRTFEVSFKDEVVPGLSIGNSEIGALCFCVECYFWRCICSNGAIVEASAGQSRFKHLSRRAFDALPDTIRQVIANSDRQQAQMVVSVNTPVSNPTQTLESFNRRFGLTQMESELVKASFEEEPGTTMFSVINAYTRAAQAQELPPQDSYKFEKIGGQILALVK
jgi:hypothetical protein